MYTYACRRSNNIKGTQHALALGSFHLCYLSTVTGGVVLWVPKMAAAATKARKTIPSSLWSPRRKLDRGVVWKRRSRPGQGGSFLLGQGWWRSNLGSRISHHHHLLRPGIGSLLMIEGIARATGHVISAASGERERERGEETAAFNNVPL